MFSYNGPNKPESKTMSTFRPVRQVAAPAAKSAISDCILSILTLSTSSVKVKVTVHSSRKNMFPFSAMDAHYERTCFMDACYDTTYF